MVDLNGWFPLTAGYTSLSPQRVADAVGEPVAQPPVKAPVPAGAPAGDDRGIVLPFPPTPAPSP